MHKALFFEKHDHRVRCTLCPHFCFLGEGEVGICRVRQNIGGELYSLVYEKAIALNVDNIEKKPLYHVYPGSRTLSLATMGCNFSCQFCQNSQISQVSLPDDIVGEKLSAARVVQVAIDLKCRTIACTYTEPTIFYEYALDIARLASENGVETVLVSNGYINREPLEMIAPFVAAMNIDLKSWTDRFYQKVIGGKRSAVLRTLELAKKLGIWVEVTTLLAPDAVRIPDDIEQMADFIRDRLGPDTPWHLSRFHPHFQQSHLKPTPREHLLQAREIALEKGLYYVYTGNLSGDVGENTFCHFCGSLLIERYGLAMNQNNIVDHACPHCHTRVSGLF